MNLENLTDAEIRKLAEQKEAGALQTGDPKTLQEAAEYYSRAGMKYRALRCLIAADLLKDGDK